jgi:hypothetical protein
MALSPFTCLLEEACTLRPDRFVEKITAKVVG